jgi:hypothetical protein
MREKMGAIISYRRGDEKKITEIATQHEIRETSSTAADDGTTC